MKWKSGNSQCPFVLYEVNLLWLLLVVVWGPFLSVVNYLNTVVKGVYFHYLLPRSYSFISKQTEIIPHFSEQRGTFHIS